MPTKAHFGSNLDDTPAAAQSRTALKMVQILKTAAFALALVAETAAFVPSSAKLPPRIDSSKWRLEQYDLPASYGGRIRPSNVTDSAFVVDTSSYHHPVIQAQPEQPSAEIDSVDMSHYESSFRGLTAPSQAGLVLSVLISLAMVVSSPAVDTSFITSELASSTQLIDESSFKEFSAAWGADLSQDLLPTLINKLHILASDLSPKVDEMLQHAREQTETWKSGSALAYQPFQDFLNTASEKSIAWQDTFSTESSKLQEQASTTLDLWQTAVASKMMEAQSVATEVSAKGSRMVEDAFLQATTFRDAVVGSMTKVQHTLGETVHEIQTSVITQFDETSAQWHESMEEFRKTADEKMLREAPILKAESLRLQSQFVDPLVLACHELSKSFNVELDREYSVANELMLQSISQLQTFWEVKLAQLQDLPWSEVSRDIQSWSTEMKTVLSETVVKLQTDLASKATEIRDIEIPGSQQALQLSLGNFYHSVDESIKELQATVSSATLDAQEQAYSNLAMWKETTDAQLAADRVALTQFYDDLTLKFKSTVAQVSDIRTLMTSTLEQIKDDFESFKKDADVKMLSEGAMLKEKAMNAHSQAKALFDTGLGKFVGPMAVFSHGWNSFWDVVIHRVQDVTTTECSKLYSSFLSHARPLQESLASNYGVAVNQIIPSATDTIREGLDFARTETQSFASAATAVSTVTSTVDVKIDLLPHTSPVVDSVKQAAASLPTRSQEGVSPESLSSLYDRLQDQLLKSPQ